MPDWYKTLRYRYSVLGENSDLNSHVFNLLAKHDGRTWALRVWQEIGYDGESSFDITAEPYDPETYVNYAKRSRLLPKAVRHYTVGSNTFSLGYMQLHGDTGMPYLAGIDPYIMVGGALATEYLNPKERVWQFKHDYDFARHGLPGLKTQIRFIQGRNIHEPVADGNGEEWERDLEVSYVVQSGSLAGVGLRVRHGHYQNNFSRDVEQTRVNIDYTVALW